MTFDVCQTASRVLLAFEENIETSIHTFHSQGLLSPFLSGQILFQSQQSSFVLRMLSDLDQTGPVMRSKLFLTVIALSIFLNKLNQLSLLHLCGFINSPHELNLDPNTLRMRFSPHKFGILDF